ncbi:hypothetical protein [Rubellicoccus peritrichatus]|uniref:Pseudouridine synthase RsuA/RluA-like domain-containing protein n=1 Tax=Rubellicoccus peritrichatus TaxID=3080537 RepID=A0AAQ3L9N8_9BACT|nr:hypothetical protein [Puniceicoccus sp. CR14]WOO41411.1 hypothetical protein RZN69_22555 [Puniceicoccus sp. CR14]
MANSVSKDAVGFPPPLLGEQPFRLPILERGDGWVALEKPIGPLIDAHPLYPDAKSIVEGIRVQASAGKPELERLELGKVAAIYFLEPEVHGIAMLASNHSAREHLRNAFGSMQFEFEFEMLGKAPHGATDLVCEAPLGYYSKAGRMVISKRHGKKSKTQFLRVGDCGSVSRWLARTAYPRPQQIQLHAREVGLEIAGDVALAHEPEVAASGWADRRLEQLGLCMRLKSIQFPFDGQSISVNAPTPKLWRSFLRRMGAAD